MVTFAMCMRVRHYVRRYKAAQNSRQPVEPSRQDGGGGKQLVNAADSSTRRAKGHMRGKLREVEMGETPLDSEEEEEDRVVENAKAKKNRAAGKEKLLRSGSRS